MAIAPPSHCIIHQPKKITAMWKLVLKNLWANRKKNIWLFIELIVVVIISWKLIDTVTVTQYAVSRDTGYDQENMYVMGISTYLTNDMRHDPLQEEHSQRVENMQRLRSMINNLQGVKSSTFALQYQLFESIGNQSNCFMVDSTSYCADNVIEFVPGTDFFTTLGIPGEKAEKYSGMPMRDNDIILDEKFAELIFPGENVEGKRFLKNSGDSTYTTIVGALPHVIPKSAQAETTVMYEPITMDQLIQSFDWGGVIVVRTRPDVSVTEFNRIFAENQKQLHAGNFYISSLTDFGTRHTAYLYRSGITNKLRINVVLAIFFGISLCLGVIGSFYLQTRRRSEEGGIMRSFGATRGFLVRELLLEGIILTTISWIIGCFIYLQYALKEGLVLIGQHEAHELFSNWTDRFGEHFMIVSLIVYAVLLIVVSIGIYIPARNISRVNPVDALRDE